MRLWHKDLIPYLPKSQLVAQWRELNSIYKKQDNHILINYIYDYSKLKLLSYSCIVIEELHKRGYKIKKEDNFINYFDLSLNGAKCFVNRYNCKNGLTFKEHNFEYLEICYFNLKEKYIRGQKDFSKEQYDRLTEFYEREKEQ